VRIANGAAYGSGVYVTPFPHIALRFAPKVQLPDYEGQYQVVFQCRVRQGSFTKHGGNETCSATGFTEQWAWVVPDEKDVRPYGICIYKSA
jgi:hypothetical protein